MQRESYESDTLLLDHFHLQTHMGVNNRDVPLRRFPLPRGMIRVGCIGCRVRVRDMVRVRDGVRVRVMVRSRETANWKRRSGPSP